MSPSAAAELTLLGLSFRDAPVAVREALAFTPDEARAVLGTIAEAAPDAEALLLSTCNRTELYVVAATGSSAPGRAHEAVRRVRPLAPVAHEDCWRDVRRMAAAAEHLVRVASGLESAVLGDQQILGQLRTAMDVAASAGTLGPALRRTAEIALRAGKRVRARTDLSAGGAGVASAVAGIVRTELGSPAGRRVLVIGAGEAGTGVARRLAKSGALVTVANRTPDRAARLAAACGGAHVPWEERLASLASADVVVVATAGGSALRAADLAVAPAALVIDVSFPRAVETGGAARVFTVDSLAERDASLLERRAAAVPDATAIVGAEMAAWRAWWDGRRLRPRPRCEGPRAALGTRSAT